MKARMTIFTVAALLLAAAGIIAFTAAQPAEFIYAKFGVDFNGDGLPDEMYDVWTDGVPGDSTEVVEVFMPPDQFAQKYPGLTRFENVRIRFALGQLPPPLAAWHQRVTPERYDVHDATLIITGQEGETLAVANLSQTWPCAVRLAQSRAGFRGDAADELELAVGRCVVVVGAANPDRK